MGGSDSDILTPTYTTPILMTLRWVLRTLIDVSFFIASLLVEFQPTQPTLHLEDTGEIRIGNSRVTLDHLLAVYQEGATPEDIAAQHPGLALADVYSTIAYYLTNKQQIDSYLEQLRQIAQHQDSRLTNHRLLELSQRLLRDRTRENNRITGHVHMDSQTYLGNQADYS